MIDIIYTTVYNLKPHLISNPGRTQGLVDESLPGPQVLSPPHTTTQGLLAGLLRLGTDFFGARLSSMATMWTSDTYRTHWNASFPSRTDPFTYIAAVDNVQTESAKSLDKFKMEIYLLLNFVQQKYYTTFTFNPLRRLSTLLTLSEGAVAAPQIAHRSSLHKNLIKFN